MSNKKYQIFVSSTFADLKEERNAISKSILDLGHIPAGMELFPAADIQQLTYIKKVIDECDYYLLVVGGRYGSVTPEGLSYTELEYEYAIESMVPVLAFVHSNPASIPVGKSEMDDTARERLASFKERVTSGRLVQFWESVDSLQAKAIISLAKAFSDVPRIGWVRADQATTSANLEKVIALQSENASLHAELSLLKAESRTLPAGLAGLETQYTFRYRESTGYHNGRQNYIARQSTLPLSEVLTAIARQFVVPHTLESAGPCIAEHLNSRKGIAGNFSSFNAVDLEAALMQLVGLKLLQMYTAQTTQGTTATFFKLTDSGQANWLGMTLRATT